MMNANLPRLVFLVTAIAATCGANRGAWADPPAPSQTPPEPIPYVRSPVLEEWDTLRSSLESLDKKLINLMNDESAAPANRVSSMGVLGAIRSTEAESPLMRKYLLFTQGEVTRPRPLVCYPAAEALTNYGRRLYEVAWAACLDERSDDYLYVLAWTFVVMDGEEVALIRVEEWIDEAGATPSQLDSFRKVRQYVRTIDFLDPTMWPRNGDPNPTD